MFWDTEFKLICKNCIQQIAKPDPLEGVVESSFPQMKAVLENTTSLASCTIISSMPFSPEMHTCSRANSHMHTHTAHIFLHLQLLLAKLVCNLNLTLLRSHLGHLWLVCGNMHSMCQWLTSEAGAFLDSVFKVAAAVLCSFYQCTEIWLSVSQRY